MKRKSIIAVGLAIGLAFSTSLYAKGDIIIRNNGLYPESISYNSKEKVFYVSSVAKGEIFKVDLDGKTTLFAHNEYPSTIGVLIDSIRDRLIVCVSDPGAGKNTNKNSQGKLAGIAIYNLTTGQQTNYYNLSLPGSKGYHLANDITVDDMGNIFVTDSFSPIIYKISRSGKPEVFVSSEQWLTVARKFGLNGIVYHPSGFLIVSHYESGKLFKVEVSDSKAVSEIKASSQSDAEKISSVDGLLLLENKLYAVNSDPSGTKKGNIIYQLTSNDSWKSFKIVKAAPTSNTYPTSVTNIGSNIYVLHSKLTELFTGKVPQSKSFKIEHISFK